MILNSFAMDSASREGVNLRVHRRPEFSGQLGDYQLVI